MWYCFLRICKENRAEINRNKLKEGKRRMECWKWKTKEKKEIMEWRDKEKETSTSWNNVTYLKRNINHNWIRLTKIIKNNHREISNKKKEGIKSKTKLYNYFKYVFLSYSVLSWIIFLCFFFLKKKAKCSAVLGLRSWWITFKVRGRPNILILPCKKKFAN